MSALIELRDVSYAYPGAEPVLVSLSLSVEQGEFLLICGESGSGKSTLLRLMNGLVPHFYGGTLGGQVLVAGRDTRTVEPRQLSDLIGFVFQDPEAQFVVEIVEDELAFGMENAGIPQRTMRRRIEEALDQVEIAHLRHRPLATLSGGERQRVAIASALTLQPQILLLDEPTSQLDPHTAEEVLTTLHKLNADLGITVVLLEHRLERVAQYADTVLTLRPGQPPLHGPPQIVLPQLSERPPLVELAVRLGWAPPPLTIKEARGRLSPAGQPSPGAPRHPLPLVGEGRGEGQPAGRVQAEGLRAERIHADYGGHPVLRDVSMALRPGEVLALMGRNGSGKTTLLRHLVGLTQPRRGRVLVEGKDIAGTPVEQVAKSVGYVPQDPNTILYHETVADEVRFTLRAHGMPAGDAEIAAVLDEFGIGHLAQRDPRDLSGGEAQRAALATVLAARQRIVLLDEPTRGLDYAAKRRLAELLRGMAAAGRAVLVVTHDVEFVARCADRALLLGEGEVVVEGPLAEVLGESLLFSTQIGKLFPGTGLLTPEQAEAALGTGTETVRE